MGGKTKKKYRNRKKGIQIKNSDCSKTIYDYIKKNTKTGIVHFRGYCEQSTWKIEKDCVLPFMKIDGKMQWDVSIMSSTVQDYVNTFYEDEEYDEIIDFDDDFTIIDSVKTKDANSLFVKFYRGSFREWRIPGVHLYLHTLKNYIRSTGVRADYVMRAIWLSNLYTLEEFCEIFSVNQRTGKKLLLSSGYTRTEYGMYRVNGHSKEAINNCLEKAYCSCDCVKRESSGFCPKMRINIYKILKRMGDEVSGFASERCHVAGELSEWKEPAFGKRKDSLVPFFSFLIVIGMLSIMGLLIYMYYSFLFDKPIVSPDSIVNFWGSVVGAMLAGLMTIITTYWIIKQGYRKDYHNERMSVLPIFKLVAIKKRISVNDVKQLNSFVSEGEVWSTEPPFEKLMMVEAENVGNGPAFDVEISGIFIAGYYDPEIQSVMCNQKHFMFTKRVDDFKCTIKFYDIYGNYYYQRFIFSCNKDAKGLPIVYTLPPELVLRTSRIRYRQ